LGASRYPALVLEVPSQRIVAAERRAANLLDPTGAPVTGHLLEEFTADRPILGPGMLAGGRLNGFESFRVLRRARGANVKVRMWVRAFEHQSPSRLVLVVLVADQPTEANAAATAMGDPLARPPTVVGTITAALCIERISTDAENLFGMPVDGLLGRPFIQFVVAADQHVVSAAFEAATAGRSGVTATVGIGASGHDETTRPKLCELLLLPLNPHPSCAFVLLPAHLDRAPGTTTGNLPATIARFAAGVEIAQPVRDVFSEATDRDIPGLGTLTTRELEIVGQLLDGNRAPAIASRLFVAPSTVRNHLATVFAKLGVHSQQQLVNLFRRS
jgi:DNA-binding CsgD family transcriptional regulator